VEAVKAAVIFLFVLGAAAALIFGVPLIVLFISFVVGVVKS
jgi:hypothetical protein